MKRTPKRNLNRTPHRRSPRKISGMIRKNPVKRLKKMKTYESPLKHFQKKGKRYLLDETTLIQPAAKRQRLSRQRDSVIIINDENDLDCSRQIRTRAAKAQNSKKNSTQEKITATDKKNEPGEITNDSVIILEDDGNLPSTDNSNPTEDVMVVWSSVPSSTKEKSQCRNANSSNILPFVIDSTPNISNLQMLRGDYPQKWLGEWLSEEKKKTKNKSKNNAASSKKNQVGKKKKKVAKQSKQQKQKEKEIEKEHEEQKEKERSKSPKEILPGKLREIIVDGPNVAKAYSNGKYFSEEGLKLVVDFFKDRGHSVKAFVPQHVRNRNRKILEDLNREGFIVFTPSRKAGTKCITPYEDRYILEYATKCAGIVVSNDQFKDLYEEKPEWRETIENRILPLTFVGDLLMFPEDPLGRHGPKLDTFLRHET